MESQMKKLLITALTCSTALLAAPAMAESTNELVVPIYEANANDDGDKVGNVHITMTEYGALFIPALEDVKSGVYGFHVHANGDCSAKEDDDGKMVPALAAGGHWDPDNTEQHKGPWDNSGHKGDLPALAIEGDESYPVLAPKITD